MGKAERLLERMKESLCDWGQDDFDTVYRGFGFSCKEGSKHRLYFHDKYPELMATVGRHNTLAKGYARTAIDLIAKLQLLQGQENVNEHD